MRQAPTEPPRLVRTTFRTSRLLDFCSRKELIAQTGHQPADWPLVVLKELVDNALDACEDAGIPPEITATVDAHGITVADRGPGLPASTIDGVLDFSVRVSSREAYVSPTRGAQGNALKTILAMPFVLDGACGRVEIAALGTRHEIVLELDRIRQEPVIHHDKHPAPAGETGTAVTVAWPDSASSQLTEAKARFLQIAQSYTVLNPHLILTVDWFRQRHLVEATAPNWTKWLPRDPTSPHWYTPEHLGRLISAYLAHDLDNGGRERTVRELVAEFRGLSGTAKQKRILDATGLARAPLSALIRGQDLDGPAIAGLLDTMQAESKAVKPDQLGVLGRAHVAARFEAFGGDMATFKYQCARGTSDGLPYVVETAFVWCPPPAAVQDSDAPAGRRFVVGVNWSPGIINPFRSLGSVGQSLDALLAEQRVGRSEPTILLIHLAMPRVEYTDRGKSSIVVAQD
jgi:DNA topoisomerase VI subunit B